ncbi:preprotein translocase subunit YajC [Actinomadura atramentaria]|uniref:preprotein translocase subunit YajC n=1 Tax=Actinomadura atramentaria TaxID=1990 RepID=UPI000373D618|nr:preprotein translocase subunit YajC [Actinomadura atramentaria]
MIIAAGNSGGGGGFGLLMLLAVPIIFYFLLIRPQNKRRREQLSLQNSIEPGARIITTAGMHATVVSSDDDGVVLEIAPGVEARFVKQAVMQVLKDDEPEEALDEDAADEDENKIDLSKKNDGALDDAPESSTGDVKDADKTPGEMDEAAEAVSTGKGADKPTA